MTTLRRGLLSDLFVGVVAKRLTVVETVGQSSNQHEFQGTKPLRRLFGEDDRRNIPARFVWINGEQDAMSEDGFLSWSNVRKGKPRSAEYHLYYSGNSVTNAMRPGDMMLLARHPDGSILIVIAPSESTIDAQVLWLFGIEEGHDLQEDYKSIDPQHSTKLDFAARYILDELGIEVEEHETEVLDKILAPLNGKFPTTAAFSELARKSLPAVDPRDDADAALSAWIEREDQLFRRLERVIVAERLKLGFVSEDDADVDAFVSFSLSVHNRRKSRMGFALENHLEAIFKALDLRFARGATTEGKAKPDFLFPGKDAYHDPCFPVERLTLLGSKSTCKDRWRQVLSEGKRITKKHLCTIEPSISESQTDEMKAHSLQLVVPKGLHDSYAPSQRTWLMDIAGFLELVRNRQDGAVGPV